MTLPDVHLAGEAVAAYVDDALSPTARDRADRHLRACAECTAVVEAQREAKVMLAASFDPALPPGLVARLREIPMTADLWPSDLGGSDTVLTVDGEHFAWARIPAGRDRGREVRRVAGPPAAVLAGALAVDAGSAGPGAGAAGPGGGAAGPGAGAAGPGAAGSWWIDAPGSGFAGGAHPAGGLSGMALAANGGLRRLGAALNRVSSAAGSRPAAARRRDGAERGGRPGSYPSSGSSGLSVLSASAIRRRRGRRLAGALAGIAFGVIASTASTGTSGAGPVQLRMPTGDSPQLVIDRSVPSQQLDAGTLTAIRPQQRRSSPLEVTSAHH